MPLIARSGALALAAAITSAVGASGRAAPAQQPCPLAGTWTLVAADKELPDGTRAQDYGTAPTGRLMIDAESRYSLQIFKQERPSFASGDKVKGTDTEFKEAVLGSSTHLGMLHVDAAAGVLVFEIEDSSFPNWKKTQQQRTYTLTGDVLTYRVPTRPDGSIPISIWRRLN